MTFNLKDWLARYVTITKRHGEGLTDLNIVDARVEMAAEDREQDYPSCSIRRRGKGLVAVYAAPTRPEGASRAWTAMHGS
jgi:hypothetical protein